MNSTAALLPAEGSLQSHIDEITDACSASTGTALRHLTYLGELLAEERERIDPQLLQQEPMLPEGNWGSLIRAYLGHALGEYAYPWMQQAQKLAEPWFPSHYTSLRKKATETSPAYLRDLNIFIDANSLSRA